MGLTLLAGLSSCNTKKPEEQAKEVQMMKDSIVQATKDSLIAANKKDSIAKAEALAQRAQAEHEAQAEKIIRKIFWYVTDMNSSQEDELYQYLRSHCTSKMLKKLASDYAAEYGNEGEEAYAVWDFRTGAQDGDGPSRIKSIKSLGDGWYRYDFLDMGNPGANKVHFIEDGSGVMKIDDLVTIK